MIVAIDAADKHKQSGKKVEKDYFDREADKNVKSHGEK